jgi:hypothetical protein
LNAPHPLEVGIPPFLGFVMGMADIITDDGFFSANLTYLGHFEVSLNPLRAVFMSASGRQRAGRLYLR